MPYGPDPAIAVLIVIGLIAVVTVVSKTGLYKLGPALGGVLVIAGVLMFISALLALIL